MRGRDALSALSATETDADCAPTRNVVVAACGTTGAAGSDRAGGEVAAEPARRARRRRGARGEGARGDQGGDGGRGWRGERGAGAGIKRSLADGLRREDEKRVKSGTRAGGGGGMMGALLGDVPSDSSDEDEE